MFKPVKSLIPGRTVVFRGTEPAELSLVEGRLELEGWHPLRLGRVHPALAGGGNSAFEQLITVPNQFVAAAQALLDPSAVDESELERQALAEPGAPADCTVRDPRERTNRGARPTVDPGRAAPSWLPEWLPVFRMRRAR